MVNYLAYLSIIPVAVGGTGVFFLIKQFTNKNQEIKNPPPIAGVDFDEESDDASNPKIYKNFSNIPSRKKKFFPFSSQEKPSKYDNYFLLKNDTSLVTSLKESVDNSDNAWTCSVQGQSVLYETHTTSSTTGQETVCHFFKVQESNIDSFECPTSFTDLELLSFENIKAVSDLPKHFLFAVKLKKNEDTADTLRTVSLYKENGTTTNKQMMYIAFSSNTNSNNFKTCSS